MTWTLVQKSTALVDSTSPSTPAYSPATTAGNLLIATVNVSGGVTAPTMPSGWTLLVSKTQGSSAIWCGIYANFNNPGGLTTISITFTGSQLHRQIYEFTCPNVSSVSAADQTGSLSSATVPATLAIVTAGNLASNNELAVTSSEFRYSAATVATLGPGTGFTQGGVTKNGLSSAAHCEFDYDLDTGSSSGATVTDTVTDNASGTGNTAGVIATFAQPTVTLIPRPQRLWQAVHRAAYR